MKYLTNSGLSYFLNKIKAYISSVLPTKTSDLTNDSGFLTGVTWNDVNNKPSFATVATSGSYNDLSNKPAIPTVNNATLTIQKNGTNVQTFTANQSTNATANITVPTKTSDLTNDSGFITEDNTKIPLAGSNAISGSLIPATSETVNLGSESRKFSHGYVTNLFAVYLNGTTDHGIDINYQYGANLILRGKNYQDSNEVGDFLLVADDGSNSMPLRGKPSGTLIWGNKNLAMQEDTIPRSGGAVITGGFLGKPSTYDVLTIGGADQREHGGNVLLFGVENQYGPGAICIIPVDYDSNERYMWIRPDGTWTWSGTAVQLVSDQRFKQQITEIDDKLLDAWEDVTLVQFKYNDAVDQKKDKARLHTGYVVQQIDKACKSHGVDVSQYGLYCHEEYPQETEEVEVEQEDGTKTKETKVIREASEHYSLRYTETLVVECAYLRKRIKELEERLEKLEAK